MFRLPPLTPLVRKLLITLATLFVLVAIAKNFVGIDLVSLFALQTDRLSIATVWQIFTYVLIVPPTNVLPFLISGLFIWLILPPFEDRYGAMRVFQLALLGTLASAVLALAVGLALPITWSAPLAGPQTITLAAMSAYAVLLPPNAEISFFGVLPLRSQQLLWVIIGLSVLSFLVSPNATSLASDLGAIGAGVAFVKFWMQRPPRRRTFQRKPGKPSKLRVVGKDDDRPDGGWLN